MIEPYHTGIIVEDVATAIPIWEAATGVPWGSVFAGPLTVRAPANGATVTHQTELAYSAGRPTSRPTRRLASQGWPIVAHGVDDDGAMAVFSYHQVPGVGLLELVSRAMREMRETMASVPG